MKKRKPTRKKKSLTTEQLEIRSQRAFKKKINNIFTGAGFNYIATLDHEMKIGLRKVEIDSMFIFENIWLICEDTIKTSDIRDHIRTKNEALGQIKGNMSAFVNELAAICPDKKDILVKYDTSRIKMFELYISKEEIPLFEEDYELFENLTFIQPQTLNYFQWIVQCIKFSARNEFFRFLNLKSSDIGLISSSSHSSDIVSPIIYPKSFTGLTNNVRIVSFMMSAEELMDTCYVLRKDDWSESIWLYQRLIDKNKIKNIRSFMLTKGEAFYNNIIVALPDSARFINAAGEQKTIYEIADLDSNCKLTIPREINSICVIDGQHRIFAHYNSGQDSEQEHKISVLRKQLHLLVTGLVFPREMSQEDRARIQSEIFLDINSNAKSVSPNILLQIKRIQNPIADESIAQHVIEKLNKNGIFENRLQVSSLETGKIKTASIVRFALRYLVTITPAEGKQSLICYWDGDKDSLRASKGEAIDAYTKFCVSTLRSYFGAIKNNFKTDWDNNTSKLLSVISINGFIIAFTRQLKINGVKEFEFYDNVFKNWEYDFSKKNFRFTSSQYRMFSDDILSQAFKIDASSV